MKVFEIMTQGVVADTPEDTLAEAAAKMYEQQTGSLLVMSEGRLIGIFTERDLLRAVARGRDPKLVQLKDVIAGGIVTIAPHAELREAAQLMASRWIRHLPVVEGERVVGVISQRDLAGIFARAAGEPVPEGQLGEEELVRGRRLIRIEAGDLD
ncbi:MAG: CBS domain-containing protein [Actinomycetota bacterium]